MRATSIPSCGRPRSSQGGGRHCRGGSIRVRLATALWLVCLASLAVGAAGEAVGNAREELQKWVEARKVISQEQRDWALGKELLNERIKLVQREIESLRGKIGEAQASITEADKKRGELVAENQKLKASADQLTATVAELESRTLAMLKRIPDTIRDRVKPLSQRIPENSKDTKLSLSIRFQNVIGVLNEVNKFNRDITLTSEVRTLPDGTSAEVTVMYVGISQAFYVSGNGKLAGIGAPGPDGWAWKPANEYAARIADAIAVQKNEKVASFVKLPIEIQ